METTKSKEQCLVRVTLLIPDIIETEIVNQLDGFDARGNIKVLMATNRPDTLDPALTRPGRLDRKVEFGLPDLDGRTHIFRIHARTMNMER